MVDVGRDDGASGGHFAAHKLGRDLIRDALREALENAGRVLALHLGGAHVLLVEVVADDVGGEVGDLRALHVFANGDELHLRGDDAGAGVGELCDHLAGLGLQGLALRIDGGLQRAEDAFALGGGVFGVVRGEVAVVTRLDGAAVIGFHVIAGEDPGLAQAGQAFFHRALVIRVAPGAGGVIDAHGFVLDDAAIEILGGGEGDLAHGHLHLRVDLALHIHAGGGGELLGGMRFKGRGGIGDHGGKVLGSRFFVLGWGG